MKVPHGTIRQSQLITTYGPGAMVDLPRHSVVVGGLDDWNFGDQRRTIAEDRLVQKIEELLQVQGLQLVVPPAESNEPGAALTGIPGWQVPLYCHGLAELGGGRTRVLQRAPAVARTGGPGEMRRPRRRREPQPPPAEARERCLLPPGPARHLHSRHGREAAHRSGRGVGG